MKKILLVFLLGFIFSAKNVNAQPDNLQESDISTYILKYRDLAIFEQIRVGIPASITLAQGILESAAGKSELAVQANNHFGIKCKNNWEGETMLHDDETKNECFRKYPSDRESYTDHSNYLRNNRRYSFLFDIPVNDYDEWAVGLRKAGYATNPKYSARLINLILKYNLQNYTTEASLALQNKLESPNSISEKKYNQEEVEEIQLTKTQRKKLARERELKETDSVINRMLEPEVKETPKIKTEIKSKPISKVSKLVTLNGLEGFYAKKGANLIYEADIRELKPSKLIDFNELEDAIVPIDMFIYCEKKLKKSATKKVHIVQIDEDMYSISQKEGIQIRSLFNINKLGSGEEPAIGARIYLQEPVTRRPQLRTHNIAIKTVTETTSNSEVIKHMEIPVVKELVKESTTLKMEEPIKEPELTNAKPIETIEDKVKEPIVFTEEIEADKTPENIISNTETEKQVDVIPPPIFMDEAEPELSKMVEEVKAANTFTTDSDRNTITIIENKPIVEEVIISKPLPKSPSTYRESNVSDELRNLKKVMDDVVYAPPLQKLRKPEPVAIKSTVAVKPKPIIKDSTTKKTTTTKTVSPKTTPTKIVTPKTTPKVTKPSSITATDSKASATNAKTVTPANVKKITPKANATNKNTTPIQTDTKKTGIKKPETTENKTTKPNSKVADKKVATKKVVKANTTSGFKKP
jgi:hypothetical protein